MIDQAKVNCLHGLIARLESVAVAFSGGTDSTLLLAMCLRVLGRERVLAVTADSPTLPRSELREAQKLVAELGAQHLIIETDELADERFAANPPDRCYYCKAELFQRMRQVADQKGCHALVYGATAADLGDYRPGMRAAKEAGAIAPLLEAGFTKEEVRTLSRELGLRTWDKPAMACLSSRMPYGSRITNRNLSQVERGEEFLRREMGLADVRLRHHEGVARIEVPLVEAARLFQEPDRQKLVSYLKQLGYTYVTLDLEGFRSGSMNEVLSPLSVAEPASPQTVEGR